jgi:hypothetical protein
VVDKEDTRNIRERLEQAEDRLRILSSAAGSRSPLVRELQQSNHEKNCKQTAMYMPKQNLLQSHISEICKHLK